MNIKYKKVPNNENVLEIYGKVILSFDLRYKEYLKWRNNNPDLGLRQSQFSSGRCGQ